MADMADAAGERTLRMAIDADCPACGWPERWLDIDLAVYGCPRCEYRSTDKRS